MKNLREEFMGLLRIIRKTFCWHSWKYFIRDAGDRGVAGLCTDSYYRECTKCGCFQVYIGSWTASYRFEEDDTRKPPELRKRITIRLLPYEGFDDEYRDL